jgi:hypothetical protein
MITQRAPPGGWATADLRVTLQPRCVLKQTTPPARPTSPAAALRAQAAAARQAPAQIPVYAIDGVTQIGIFQFGPTGG